MTSLLSDPIVWIIVISVLSPFVGKFWVHHD